MDMQPGQFDSFVSNRQKMFCRISCINAYVHFCTDEYGKPAGGTGQGICACNFLLFDSIMGTYPYHGGTPAKEKGLYFVWPFSGDSLMGNSKQSVCGYAGVYHWRCGAFNTEGIQESVSSDCHLPDQCGLHGRSLWDSVAGNRLQSSGKDGGQRICRYESCEGNPAGSGQDINNRCFLYAGHALYPEYDERTVYRPGVSLAADIVWHSDVPGRRDKRICYVLSCGGCASGSCPVDLSAD